MLLCLQDVLHLIFYICYLATYKYLSFQALFLHLIKIPIVLVMFGTYFESLYLLIQHNAD